MFAVVAKSPLASRPDDGLSSSHFAITGKPCGAAALVILGACAAPSVLVIEDAVVRVGPVLPCPIELCAYR